MTERTALGEQILKHWREHCPRMVRDLETMNRLDQAVFETQERVGDLLHELMIVKQMDYQAAWEMAREEWAIPPGNETPKQTLPPSTKFRGTRPRNRRCPRPRSAGQRAPETAVAPVHEPEIVEPEQAPPVPARDFRIAEAHRIGQGGLKEKARDNIAAIRTLRLVA